MNGYHKIIIEATGCNESDCEEIEDYMRDCIFHSTLDWQTKAQLKKAARTAWKDIQWMRSPEGKKLMEEYEKQML